MMIFKYPVLVTDSFRVSMPSESELLTVQVQRGEPVLWALVNEHCPGVRSRHFTVRGTGHRFPPDESTRYIGTFQLEGGDFVGHLFEVIE